MSRSFCAAEHESKLGARDGMADAKGSDSGVTVKRRTMAHHVSVSATCVWLRAGSGVQTLGCDNIDALDANAYWCSAALLTHRPNQQRADVATMVGIVKKLARFVLGSTLALAACAEPIPVSVTELGTNLTPGYGFTAVDVNDNGQIIGNYGQGRVVFFRATGEAVIVPTPAATAAAKRPPSPTTA